VSLTSLSSCDDIAVLENSRDGVGLDRGGVGIAAEVNVVDHCWVKTSSMELYTSIRKYGKIEEDVRRK
jgi:hypothetical protein